MAAHLAADSDFLREFEEQGYVIVPGALPADTTAALTDLVNALYARRANAGYDPYARRRFDPSLPVFMPNILSEDQQFVNLLDWPATFPLVWGILGWNIYCYHTHVIVTPPRDPAAPARFGFHRDSGRANLEMESRPLPRLSLKVSYWLSDASAPGRGNLYVVPGSHVADNPPAPAEAGMPAGAIPVLANRGDAVLFDRRLWHSSSPNDSDVTRKVIFMGYGYRWIRPKDDMTIAPAVLQRNDPIRRQLMGDDTDANGKYSPREDAVPLRNWLRDEGLLT